MPKVKTNKSIARRVKITGTGKVKRKSPGASHLKSTKSPSRLRRFRADKDVSKAFSKHVKRMLGM
jgi:large subunit ribosomal protein L35